MEMIAEVEAEQKAVAQAQDGPAARLVQLRGIGLAFATVLGNEVFLYRPGVSGHKMLLRGRPDWGACGDPFASGLRRAAVGILLQQPVLVIAGDEGPDRNANLRGIAENPAPHDLLL